MNIELDMNDFRLLYHTSCSAEGFDFEFCRFEPIKGTPREDLIIDASHQMYWVGEGDLQALVAFQLVLNEDPKAGLFWDTAENDGDSVWGYCILTNYHTEA